MENPRKISIDDFNYHLPEEKIAKFPNIQRDRSRLLVYDKGDISHHNFQDLPGFLSGEHSLVFNNARVINARLQFKKPTGGLIEIFVLEPHNSTPEIALKEKGSTVWKCFVGGAKKWKEGAIQLAHPIPRLPQLSAELIARTPHFLVEFSWDAKDMTWGDILDSSGEIPLPPYINRSVELRDSESYQTVYARNPGSVAAPTAGLHFSDSLLDSLEKRGVKKLELTLHVGAGTFKPVSAKTLEGHDMHEELIAVDLNTVRELAAAKSIVAVGTTALRSMESIFWLACKIKQGNSISTASIGQWDGFELYTKMDRKDAMQVLSSAMEDEGLAQLALRTSLLIAPGYQFRMVGALITNFHMPKSTLLLLIAAAIGSDWKKLYEEALMSNYRFLSYGDSSLLMF